MPFQNFVCWRQDRVGKVIDTEATEPSEEDFLATHYPIRMRRVRGAGEAVDRRLMSQDELRSELLDAGREHVHIVIQGSAGSGKSHLVRWLHIKTPQESTRHVVLIRKSGTNLKRVIESILQGIEGPSFDDYRQRLSRATSDLTIERAREEFLNQLAVAVGPNGPKSTTRLPDSYAQEEREDLIECLPALLYDNAFRRAVVGRGGIVDQVAEHVLGNAGRERRVSPRKFLAEDIPTDIKQSDLTKTARDFYSQIGVDPSYRETIVAWVNENIDWAMMRMLDLSGDDISQLMMDLREELHQHGKELVLLIEDFAKLQGIDRQLLEALLVRPTQGTRRLCTLRSTIAVTTGYYESALQTVRDRTDLVVDLDIAGTGQKRDFTLGDLASFSARYLNAIRLADGELKAWYDATLSEPETVDAAVPNACDTCEYRSKCHAAFGKSDGRGLYPFTARALDEMFSRYTSKIENRGGTFNPRDLLNHVIKHTLQQYSGSLEEGRFPPESLLVHFGGAQMGAMPTDELRRKVQADQFGRYQALYELWGDCERLSNISEGVFEAFGLARGIDSGSLPTVVEAEPVAEPSPVRASASPLPSALQDRLKELDTWANGGALSPATATNLRGSIYDAAREWIDWDTEMLVRSYHAAKTDKAFRQTSIHFARSVTSGGRALVQIVIPLSDDFTFAAIALRGLLLYEHHGSWQFDQGSLHCRTLLEFVDQLGDEIVKQIRKLPSDSDEWDPVPAAVELLTIGARIFGLLPASNATVSQRLNSLFAEWTSLLPPADSTRSVPWKQISTVLSQKGDAIVDVLKSRLACTKGGGLEKAQVMDAAALLPSLERTRAAIEIQYLAPKPIRSDYLPLEQVQARVQTLLPLAIEAERSRHLDWLRCVSALIPPDLSKKEVLDSVKAVTALADAEGLSASAFEVARHQQLATRFRGSKFEECRQAVEEIERESTAHRQFALLGRTDQEAMAASEEFLEQTERLLSGIERRLQRAIDDLIESGDIRETQKLIEDQLDTLINMTTAFAGDPMAGGANAE